MSPLALVLRRLLSLLVLSVASAVAVSVLTSSRKRPKIEAAPTPEPLQLTLPAPTVSFEIVRAGGSALLRVHTAAAGREHALLVLDSGESLEILTPLPSGATGGALGFVCDLAVVETVRAYHLQIGEKTVTLAEPVELPLASAA